MSCPVSHATIRAQTARWEGIVDAATGNCRPRVGEAPPDWDTTRATYSAIPLASNFAAFLAASSVVMALVARQRSGRGQHIEFPFSTPCSGDRSGRRVRHRQGSARAAADRRQWQWDVPLWRWTLHPVRSVQPSLLDLVCPGGRHLPLGSGPARIEKLRDPAANARLHDRWPSCF